jgi:hypothetical protein
MPTAMRFACLRAGALNGHAVCGGSSFSVCSRVCALHVCRRGPRLWVSVDVLCDNYTRLDKRTSARVLVNQTSAGMHRSVGVCRRSWQHLQTYGRDNVWRVWSKRLTDVSFRRAPDADSMLLDVSGMLESRLLGTSGDATSAQHA